jgi:hypothetical protein
METNVTVVCQPGPVTFDDGLKQQQDKHKLSEDGVVPTSKELVDSDSRVYHNDDVDTI